VNFWVDGGWDQPKCEFPVNPLFFLHFDKAQGLEGKNNNAPINFCLCYNIYTLIYFVALRPSAGHGLLILEVF
jgi:hypothetical protein